MSEYLERSTVNGYFKRKVDAKRWCAEQRRHGYDVAGPYRNPFAFSYDHPWEATATRNSTVVS